MYASDVPLRRLALLIEYDGTAYGGSQYQKNAPTVQDSLERALSSLTGEPVRVALAGRTDAGVHAAGQVAAFSTGSRHPAEVFVQALNYHLPTDIAVRSAVEVATDFDPRRRARSRCYRYTVYSARYRPALRRHYVWHLPEPLDVEAMGEAAALLCGRHDFAAFTQPSSAARQRTERLVCRSQVTRRGPLIIFELEANAFLPQMVRRLAGALVEVGRGRLSPEGFETLLREARPGAASLVAPARGLCLLKVRYDNRLFDDEADEDLQP